MTEQELLEAAGLVYQRKKISAFVDIISTLTSVPDGLPLQFEISVKTWHGDYVAHGRDKNIQISAAIAISTLEEIRRQIAGRLAQMGIDPEPESAKPDPLMLRVDELGLSVRTANALANGDIICLGDLVQKSADDLMRMPNLGRRSLNEINEALAQLELCLMRAA